MDKYTKEILDLLKDRYIQLFGNKTFSDVSEMQSYWLKDFKDNLIHPMDANAKKAYGEGAGNEIKTGKIGALKSSSALTYNIFWDQIAEIIHANGHIGNGVYKVEFEKKLRTLKSSSISAHLDAFLYCKHTKEAIACEMKMTEWIFNKPGLLRASYLKPESYFDSDFGTVMVPLAKELMKYEYPMPILEEYPCGMERYDAFQMFKHVSACYTACKTQNPGEIRKLTLVNCAWTLQNPSVLSAESYSQYIAEERIERMEFDQFKRTMEPIKKCFSDIGVDFDVCFYSFNDFLAMFNKTTEELDYLRRYNI